MPEDLVTGQGVDEAPDLEPEPKPKDEPREPDPAGPGGALPDEPPASPTPPSTSRPAGPGQELEEGEG
jgi:hypothetical protein